ncbi:cupin domain-containing protein [Dasania marina]|uniref:cupin domain-containing protein n=1 Tax=Dasania marina TaxID=471499 RepID=UPI0030DD4BCF|tara:strand:+ start:47905 stop:48654 length:750 start_codon:yes stop_codon:yes gene_type:complete
MSDKSIIRLSANPAGFGEVADELSQDMFASAIPAQHSHIYYEDEALGLFIGVWDTDTMVEAAGPYGCDEFMWLLEGECEIKNNRTGVMEKAKAGEAFIIPKGYDCQWQQTGYLRKFFVISEHPQETIPAQPTVAGIIIPKADAPLSAMRTAAPFAVTQGAAPQEHVCYTDVTGKFIAGTWASEAFESAPQAFPYNEFAYVQAGSISLYDEAGNEQCFNAGDAFFIPESVVCHAIVSASVTLFFTVIATA